MSDNKPDFCDDIALCDDIDELDRVMKYHTDRIIKALDEKWARMASRFQNEESPYHDFKSNGWWSKTAKEVNDVY